MFIIYHHQHGQECSFFEDFEIHIGSLSPHLTKNDSEFDSKPCVHAT